MFGISFSEILLILILALVVFGPEQLPAIATRLGKSIATLRKFKLNLQQQLYEQSGFNQVANIRQEVQQTISEFKEHLQLSLPTITHAKLSNFNNENEFLYQEFYFLYQPELDFNQQPELFDEF